MLVALDGFKHVNESFGHQFGDRVLRRMAQRLRGMVKPHGVARLGGDEYLLLLSDDQAAKQSALLAQQVLESIAQTCSVDGREISITLFHWHGHLSPAWLDVDAGHECQRRDARVEERRRRDLLDVRSAHGRRLARAG